ncbi:MAG TPA: RNA polymerase sigma factor [Rhodothermales bacterium]|nr:RNA polymerase sigma factor [Rhodothermales bacterium]
MTTKPDIQPLLDHLDLLQGYARKKTGDPALAADAVQESLLKALEAAPTLREDDKLLPWFYRILNNTIADLHRRRQVEVKYQPRLAAEMPTTYEMEGHAVLCQCIEALIPTLNPDYANVILALELGDQEPQVVADKLGITRNNLKVRRHRARQQLKQRLEETCRACAAHGCLDCSCQQRTS